MFAQQVVFVSLMIGHGCGCATWIRPTVSYTLVQAVTFFKAVCHRYISSLKYFHGINITDLSQINDSFDMKFLFLILSFTSFLSSIVYWC